MGGEKGEVDVYLGVLGCAKEVLYTGGHGNMTLYNRIAVCIYICIYLEQIVHAGYLMEILHNCLPLPPTSGVRCNETLRVRMWERVCIRRGGVGGQVVYVCTCMSWFKTKTPPIPFHQSQTSQLTTSRINHFTP